MEIENNGMSENIGMNEMTVFEKPLGRLYKFYLSGAVKPSTDYIQWFETIRNANENDVIMFHINSFGGDLFSAIQFMRVMNETKAQLVASVEGICMSAATLIFLSAKHWEISKHTIFMFHNYTSGNFGKGGELFDHITHERKWSESLWRDVYKGFLSETEIESILNNKDIWLSGDDVTKRLIARAAQEEEKKMTRVSKPKKATKTSAKKTGAKKSAAKKTSAKKSSGKKRAR